MKAQWILCLFLVGLMCFYLANCGSHTVGEPASGEPLIGVSEDTLDFGYSGLQRSLVIYNTGGGALQWWLTDEPAWIEASSNTGNLSSDESESVLLTLSRDLLESGENSGSMALNSNGGNLTITLRAEQEVGAVLGELPDTLDFGTTLDSIPMTITNAGGDTLAWYIPLEDPYFSVSPNSGTTTNQSIIWIFFNRTGAPLGSHQAALQINSNGGNATVQLKAFAMTTDGFWLSYGGDADGYYLAQPTDYFFVVRFDRPPDWQDFKVSRVRVMLYTLSGAYDDVQLFCWDVEQSSGYLFPDLYDERYETGTFDPVSGWNEWTVNWQLNLSTFCVGYYQPDAASPIYPDPYYNNTSPAARSYLVYEGYYGGLVVDLLSEWDWCLEVFVEPVPTAAGLEPQEGVWLEPAKNAAHSLGARDRPRSLARIAHP